MNVTSSSQKKKGLELLHLLVFTGKKWSPESKVNNATHKRKQEKKLSSAASFVFVCLFGSSSVSDLKGWGLSSTTGSTCGHQVVWYNYRIVVWLSVNETRKCLFV
jgi:hypothetical protein